MPPYKIKDTTKDSFWLDAFHAKERELPVQLPNGLNKKMDQTSLQKIYVFLFQAFSDKERFKQMKMQKF